MTDYLSRIERTDNGCWNYTGTIGTRGYGQILQTTAHRWFYTKLVGPIPNGLQIDHLCRNKQCVNPAHLEPVTGAENARRRDEGMTHCPRGHEFNAENTYMRARGQRECRPCRAERQRAARRQAVSA